MVISKEASGNRTDEDILRLPVDDQSRLKLMKEMEALGINTSALESLTIGQLSDLLFGLNRMANTKSIHKPEPGEKQKMSLSSTDKKMLTALLHSNGDMSSLALSRQLRIPLTTVQR
ncbi:MAG: hypothetical protein ACREAI_06710, partial [Nitrososphaera sp.]